MAKRKVSAHWKSRIVAHERVDPKTIKPNPLNWRVHGDAQQQTMRAAFDRIGVLQGVIVNRRTGHLIDGEMRWQLAIDNDEAKIDVTFVDIDEEEERTALAIINPLGELGATDPEKLAQLIAGVNRQDDGPLSELLANLEEIASQSIVKNTGSGLRGPKSSNAARHPVMRLMLENPDVRDIERAISMTGEANRGKALLAICRAFIKGASHASTERQLDVKSESGLADQLAEALAPLAGGAGDARGTGADILAGLSQDAARPGNRARSNARRGARPTAPDLVGDTGKV